MAKDWAEHREIGAFPLGPLQLLHRVRGNTRSETPAAVIVRRKFGAMDSPGRWTPWAPQASAISVRELTRIFEPWGFGSVQRPANQVAQFARRQVLLPDLNVFDAVFQRAANMIAPAHPYPRPIGGR